MGGEYQYPTIQTYIDWVGEKAGQGVGPAQSEIQVHGPERTQYQRLRPAGGYIYITRGLISLAENEAEIAGVPGP